MDDQKKKDKLAVALRYDGLEQDAPKVVAKGRGNVADNIIEEGEKSGLKSIENPELASELMTLDLQEEIPEELYEAVAQIMSYIYRLDEESQW